MVFKAAVVVVVVWLEVEVTLLHSKVEEEGVVLIIIAVIVVDLIVSICKRNSKF